MTVAEAKTKKTSFETEKMVSGRKVVFLFYLSFFGFLVSLRGCLFFGFGSQNKKLMEQVVFSSKSIIARRIFFTCLKIKNHIFPCVFLVFHSSLLLGKFDHDLTATSQDHRLGESSQNSRKFQISEIF